MSPSASNRPQMLSSASSSPQMMRLPRSPSLQDVRHWPPGHLAMPHCLWMTLMWPACVLALTAMLPSPLKLVASLLGLQMLVTSPPCPLVVSLPQMSNSPQTVLPGLPMLVASLLGLQSVRHWPPGLQGVCHLPPGLLMLTASLPSPLMTLTAAPCVLAVTAITLPTARC